MDKKNFLFVSSDALHIDCARRIASEGHEVRYFIENVEDNDIGDGFVPKVLDWKPASSSGVNGRQSSRSGGASMTMS